MSPQHIYPPIVFASEWRARGVHPRDLPAAVEARELHRAAPGIYVTPEVWSEQDLQPALACHRTGGVVGMLTAAVRHGLCDASPSSIDVIVRWEDLRRPPAGMPIRIVRSRNPDALAVGVEVLDFHGIEWRCTDPARTVVDLYRITPDAWRQHAVAALATYMQRGLPVRTVHKYAAAFDCWELLRPEVEAIDEAKNRGMNP